MISLLRVIKFGLQNLWRHRTPSAVSIAVLAFTLFSISFFIIQNTLIERVTKAIKEKVDMTVFFHDSAPEAELQKLREQLASFPTVASTRYVSKADALAIWEQRTAQNPKLSKIVTPQDNPLPRSMEIRVHEPEDLEGIAIFLQNPQVKPFLRKVTYQETKEIIRRLVELTRFTKRVGLTVSAIFIFISIFVLLNTIRLAIFSRREEIAIQKLVGATPTFIRGPFLFEALLIGLIAAAGATGLLGLAHRAFEREFLPNFPSIATLVSETPEFQSFFAQNFAQILGRQALLGVGLAILGSLIATGRYLKEARVS